MVIIETHWTDSVMIFVKLSSLTSVTTLNIDWIASPNNGSVVSIKKKITLNWVHIVDCEFVYSIYLIYLINHILRKNSRKIMKILKSLNSHQVYSLDVK